MQMKLRRLTGAMTFVIAATIVVACAEGATTPSAPETGAAQATQSGRLQPGEVALSMDPCPGGVCDGGGGGGGSTPTTYLRGFEDAMPGTGDYYALEFNFKNAAGAQVGTTKEQRWHGNSFYLGEVPGNSVNVGQAIPCGGKVQVEVRRAHLGATTWEPAGNFFISSNQNNAAVTYYDPTRGWFGYVKLAFSGCA